MSALKPIIQNLINPRSSPQSCKIEQIYKQVISLSLSDSQQLIRELSYILYQKQQSFNSLFRILKLIKQLLLTGSLPLYLLINVYIFPWVVSINKLHADRPNSVRAQLLSRDVFGKGQKKSSKQIEQCEQLLKFSGEFLVFFGQNMKFHPYSKYKIKNGLAKQFSQGFYSRSLTYFIQQDLSLLHQNLKEYNSLFREHLKQLTAFLAQKAEQCLTDSTKYNQASFLLLSLIQISESYCISTIIYRLSSFVYSQHLSIVCQLVHSIVNLAEIQAMQLINIKFLPCMLEMLLPVDFKKNEILTKFKKIVPTETLNQLADYYYIWYDKSKLASISTKIYDYSYPLIYQLKKPIKLSYQNQLHQFAKKLSVMNIKNDIKRTFAIDQNQQAQDHIASLLKQLQFCLSSQRRQRIAYENVLDQLTITQKDHQSDKLSSFSQSFLRSLNQSKGLVNYQMHNQRLSGPPHKKFAQFQSSISQICSNHQKMQENQTKIQPQLETNIYNSKQNSKIYNFQKDSQRSFIQQSIKQVNQTQIQLVTAKSSPTKTPISSPVDSLSFNSSKFSQKQNNKNSIKEKKSLQFQVAEESGDFVHFQNNSLAKTQKNKPQHQIQKPLEEEILFQDSLPLQKSDQQSIIEYGIDKNAKMPPTIKKPKFAFKAADTNDSSLILKHLQSSIKQAKKQSEPLETQNVTPRKTDVQKRLDYLHSSPKLLFTQKAKLVNLKEASGNIYLQSSSKSSQKGQLIKSNHFSPKQKEEVSNKSSLIHEISAEPNVVSEGNSSKMENVPSNFGSLFKRTKIKQEKASSICSSRSLRKIRSIQREVQMPDLKKMRQLQNQLGKLKNQTENMNKILSQKEQEKKELQKMKKKIGQQDPYFLKRQNEIMKKILKNRKGNASIISSTSSAKLLSQELKKSSIKNKDMNLKDYNPEILKLKLQNIKGYAKQTKNNIVANRCFILKNDFIEVGYSFKNKVLTLYFTLKYHCESLDINLNQNSIIYSQSISRQFDRVIIGRQLKFKTLVKGTKQEPKFTPSQLQINISYEQKLQKKTECYSQQIPLTPYNLATPQSQEQFRHFSRDKDSITHYVTPLYNSCDDLLRKGVKYLEQLFPHGKFDDIANTFSIYYIWKERSEEIQLKLKERMFRLQGVGHPLQTGKQLIQSIISMLVVQS